MQSSIGTSQREQKVIFLHIPKTGGSTLTYIISRNYQKSQIFGIGNPRDEYINKLKNLSEEEKKKIKVINGHTDFGCLHEAIYPPYTYITLLRDPVDRVISNYYVVMLEPTHWLHEEAVSKSMTLKDYVVSKKDPQIDNGQTRAISGIEGVELGQCSGEMLEVAKKNINEMFSLVCLTERFDESLIVLASKMGWKLPYYIPVNVNKSRLSEEKVSKNTFELIEDSNRLDRELYEFASQKLTREIELYGDRFQSELRMLKMINKLYNIGFLLSPRRMSREMKMRRRREKFMEIINLE